MTIRIHVESMKAAEQLSYICKGVPNEMFLRSEQFCIDPKSTLGILAMMYSARGFMTLDTGALAGEELSRFLQDIDEYIVKENGEKAAS